jgi:hypothetical protein
MIFSVILVTMVVAVSWLLAWKLYGFHDVMEATKDWSSYRLVEKAQLVAWSRQAVLMCLPAVLAAGFFGLFISVIMENSGSAVAVAVLFFLPLNWVITNLAEKFSKYIFNSYMSRSLTVLSERAQGFNEPLRQWKEMDVSMFIIVPAAYICFFFLASLVVFQRKDVLV